MQKAKIIRINRWNRDRPGGHVENYLNDVNADPYPPFRETNKKASRKKQRRQAKKIIEEALISLDADQRDLMYDDFDYEMDCEYEQQMLDEYYYDLECERELQYKSEEYEKNLNDDFYLEAYYDWEYDYD